MSVADQIELLRRKRRAQLDEILKTAAPQPAQMSFQPVQMPQAQGSKIVSAIPILGALQGIAAQPTNPNATSPPLPVVQQEMKREGDIEAQLAKKGLGAKPDPSTAPSFRVDPNSPIHSPRPDLFQRIQNSNIIRALSALF